MRAGPEHPLPAALAAPAHAVWATRHIPLGTQGWSPCRCARPITHPPQLTWWEAGSVPRRGGQCQADCLFPQVCGSPDIPLHLLKSVATYKGIEASAPLAQWFWEVMESLSNTERSLFLRFVWGRTRLPRTIADFRGRDFVIQVRLPPGSGVTCSSLP